MGGRRVVPGWNGPAFEEGWGRSLDESLSAYRRPGDDIREYRRALGDYATGVTVVTAIADGRVFGITANSFSSVSLEPPLVSWSVGLGSQSHDGFLAAGRYMVHVLSQGQMDLARHFAKSSADKFADREWEAGPDGCPLLPGAIAVFSCVPHTFVRAGDHTICIAEVEQYLRTPHEPLVFAQGRFGIAVDHPSLAEPAEAEGTDAAAMEGSIMVAVKRAHMQLVRRFERHYAAENLGMGEARILAHLKDFGPANSAVLAAESFISVRETEDAVARLQASGDIRDRGGSPTCFEITPSGTARIVSLRNRARAFEAAELANIDQDDLDATFRVMSALEGQPPSDG